MTAFPTIGAPSYGKYGQKLHKAQTRIPFESGVVQSAARHTSARYIFRIGWKALTTADYGLLVTHFTANQGGTFAWTHPLTSVVYTVRYADDALPEAVPVAPGYWELDDLILEEA